MSRPYYAPKQTYIGNGSVDTYSFDFKIEAVTQLLVVVLNADGEEIERLRGDDTTFIDSVEFDAQLGGGSVTLLANLTSAYRIGIFLDNNQPAQTFEFANKKTFSLKRIESALDFIVGPLQRLTLLAKQSLRIHDMDDESTFDTQLPPGIEDYADCILAVHEDGDKFTFGPTVTNIELWKNQAQQAAIDAANSASDAATSAMNASSSADDSEASAIAAAASAATAVSDSAAALAAAQAAADDAAEAAASAQDAADSAAAATGVFTIHTVQNIGAGGQITLGSEVKQWLKVQGNASPRDASTTPFSGTPVDGMMVVLEGQDDSKTLTISHNDANGGCINPNGGDIYLNKYSNVTYVYDATALRYKAIAGNGI